MGERMKTHFIRALFALLIIAYPASSAFALADLGIYGGYSFAGSSDISGSKSDLTGWQYGVIGHLNKSVLPMLLRTGAGAYLNMAPLEGDNSGYTYDRATLGLDFYAQLDMPIIIHPYAKFQLGIYERMRVLDGSEEIESENSYFQSYALGGGAAVTVFPMLQLFGEYLFSYAIADTTSTTQTHTMQLGVRVSL